MGSTNNLGKIIILISILLLAPLAVLPFYVQEIRYADAFVIPAVFSFAFGLSFTVGISKPPKFVTQVLVFMSCMRRGSPQVLFVWCYAFLVGGIPFIIGGQLTPLLSFFESVSGWTTTGLTVADIANMPHIFLFYRSFMQYCGGLGFVVMITMIIRDRRITTLYNAEGHMDMIRPSLKGTAMIISQVYLVWLAIGTLAYRLCGMPLFDSICHVMSALSTAGFSTQVDSINAYHSVPIDIVTMVLMLVGATNFVVVLSLTKWNFRQCIEDTEFAFMLKVTLVSGLIASIGLFVFRSYGIPKALLHGFFGIITTFTTTGYSIDDYANWPALSLSVVAVLMIIGGCAGSTAGGIKMNRTFYLIENMLRYVKRQVQSPLKITTYSYNRNHVYREMNETLISNSSGFLACYMLVLVIGVMVVSASSNCSLGEAAFEFTSALGTVGISNGLTSPSAPAITLIAEMIAMILGRLEIIMVFIGVYGLVNDIRAAFAGLIRLMNGN